MLTFGYLGFGGFKYARNKKKKAYSSCQEQSADGMTCNHPQDPMPIL